MGKGVKTKKKNPGVGIDFKRAKHKVSISASWIYSSHSTLAR